MAVILNIDSATTACSVALALDGDVQASRFVNDGYSHAENLADFVDQVLNETGKSITEVDAIAISSGPGSYTGLRIGVSLAKGLCYGSSKPLIAIPTLQQMCLHSAVQKELNYLKDPLLCPMIDARRMEVYAAVYDVGLLERVTTNNVVLEPSSFSDQLAEDGVLFFGDGAPKFKEIVDSKSAYFVDDVWPSAEQMAPLAEIRFQEEVFEDVAYFEPFYLKPFQGTTPRKKV